MSSRQGARAESERAGPPDNDVTRAAQILRDGGLVAMPTETVYGLAADARDEAAVRRVFEVKRRPTDHPLIVHVADSSQLDAWAIGISDAAYQLSEAFWPGPLTLLLSRHADVLDIVTAGRPTVGLRVPAHPVTTALLRAFGGGLAAPSANRFGRVSPTTAQHVRADLGDDVDAILDGGPCAVGLESTIVDCTLERPMILRPGAITAEQIEAVLGRPIDRLPSGPARAPGMLEAHYAPRARIELVANDAAAELAVAGHRSEGRAARRFVAPSDPGSVARHLYSAFREADRDGLDALVFVLAAESGIGVAINDRLRRAARSAR